MTRQRWRGAGAAALAAAVLLSAGCGDKAAGESGSDTGAASSTTTSSASSADSSASTAASGESTTASSSAAKATEPVKAEYAAEDTQTAWDAASSTTIQLTGGTAAVTGKGASVKGATVTITAAGTYVVSGSLTSGQLLVDADKTDIVRIVLNGADIACGNSAALYSKKAAKTIVTLAPGTQNTLTDGASYTFPDAQTDEPTAALFAKDDLTINGSGTLTVVGNYKHGIASKDTLTVTGGTLRITSASDGIRGRDGVAIQAGSFTIEAGTDGIQANNDEDAAKGWISLDGGDFTITAGNDGIQAETALQVSAGTYRIKTGGGSANSSTDSKGGERPGWGQWGGSSGGTAAAETPSAKGLKAGSGITVTGGDFTIDSSDDSIHSNGSVSIAGGTFALSSGDDGVHADGSLTVSKGTLSITKSYEGLEGASITISGGDIQLKASDDGLNAAGGNDSSSLGGRPGQNNFLTDSTVFIRITGGTLFVDADGDGIDSNGSLYIDGGTILVCGPTSGGDGALDYDGACAVTGGLLVAAGSAGMAQAPGTTSSQPSLMVTYSSAQQANTLLCLTAADGQPVAAFSPTKAYQTVVISSPALKQGDSYTLYTGGMGGGAAKNGLYATYTPGEKLTAVTLSSVVTSISDNGQAVTGGGMGGPGGMGGGRR